MTRFSFIFVLTLALMLLPELASAQPFTGDADAFSNTVGAGLCNVFAALTGSVAQGIATLAVLFLGIGAFFGKVNWGLAVMVAVGIGAIFGASTIVSAVRDDSSCV